MRMPRGTKCADEKHPDQADHDAPERPIASPNLMPNRRRLPIARKRDVRTRYQCRRDSDPTLSSSAPLNISYGVGRARWWRITAFFFAGVVLNGLCTVFTPLKEIVCT